MASSSPTQVAEPYADAYLGRWATRWLNVALWGWIALTLCAVGITLLGIPARLGELRSYDPRLHIQIHTLIWEVLLAVVFFGAAGVVALMRRGDAVALLLAYTCTAIGAVEPGMSDALLKMQPIWGWPVLGLRALELAGCLLVLLCFPDGQMPTRWIRHAAGLWVAFVLACLCFPALPANPLYGPSWRATPLLSYATMLLWCGVGIAAQIWRYRHAASWELRQQVKWVMLGLGAAMLGMIWYYGLTLFWPAHPLYVVVKTPVWALLMVCAPVCIGVAVARHQLWQVDQILSRALVYTLLTVCIGALHVGAVAVAGALFADGGALASLPATALAALLVVPLRDRLQRGVNRVLYGERDDPAAVIARLGRRLEGALPADQVLLTIVETLVQAMRIPYAAIALPYRADSFRVVASAGAPRTADARYYTLDLFHQGEVVGRLSLAHRGPSEPFSPADIRLAQTVAQQAGLAVHTAQLAADLRRSREGLRVALEEERRRMRRDLHDGLGPALAAQPFTISAIRSLVARDPAAAQAMLDDLAAHSRDAYADLRRLVYALRPHALDELGLVGAVRQYIAQHAAAAPALSLDAPHVLPPLPAAVEVAAYRIVAEAVTNVIKHAHASRCVVALALDPHHHRLLLTVDDDGCGLPARAPLGVGMRSMRERSDELGGLFVTGKSVLGGTQVQVHLPLSQEEETMLPIRVLIADDHAVFRYGLRARLAVELGLEVVGEATTGQEAIDMVARLAPHVAVLDLHMPGMGGVEATRRICAAHPGTHVLVLTQFDGEAALAVLQAGARGYLLKDEDVDTVVEAIRAVALGKTRYSPAIDARIRATWGAQVPPADSLGLTSREREVLRLMVRGLTNSAIAAQLAVEEHTVRNYVSDIYSKLGLEGGERTRQAAIRRAIGAGFGDGA